MADDSELAAIAEDISALQDKGTLSTGDIHRLMAMAGRLTGILRTGAKDPSMMDFIQKADTFLFTQTDNISTLFYIIPVAIELLDQRYNGYTKSSHKRYHSRKKTHKKKLEVETPKSEPDIIESEIFKSNIEEPSNV